MPLREHFSLPFFFAMLVTVSRFLGLDKTKTSGNLWSSREFALIQIFMMTFLFVITWQFAQFALLLHSVVCYVLATSQLLQKDHVG